MQIYVHRNNEQLGPFTEAEVRAKLASGALSPQDHVWWQGQEGWIPLSQSALMAPATPVTAGISPAPYTAGAIQPTSQFAIWSLVCGCASLICGLFAAVPAIVLGHLALGDIKRNPGRQGRGLALGGLIIGYIMVVIFVLAICFYAAMFPTILKAVKDQQARGQLFIPTPSTNSSDDNSTPAPTPDQTTNAPDQATPATTPDQSTNSAPATPAPDQSTNSADSTTNSPASTTNAPDSSSNAAPMNQ